MEKSGWNWFKIRMVVLILACLAGIGGVIYKCYSLQIVNGAHYRQLAEDQYIKTIELPSRRGVITDRNGVNLAVSMTVDSVFVQPKYFKKMNSENLPRVISSLGRALKMSPESIAEKLNSPKHFSWLKRRISQREADAVSGLELEGISTYKEFKRYYPLKQLGAQVVGFTDIDGQGQAGIEKYFNHSLKGQVHVVRGFRDARGRDLFDENTLSETEMEGNRLELTIDANVQRVAEEELEKAVTERRAVGGWAVVMDPMTGEIIALANYPSFDPNDPSSYSDHSRNNQALTNPFEPGSTMKSFLLAAALEEKTVKPEDTFDCENGYYPIGSRVIHDVHPYGLLTVSEVIKKSSNICSAKIGLKMGREKLYSHLRLFGFGEPTEVTLPAETRGILPPVSRWADISTATISFGQGVSVSAIQLANAFAAVANGGNLLRPQIVRRILNTKGEVIKKYETDVRKRAVSEGVAKTASSILATVTESGGTGTAAAMEGFSVAGKTGTAQKVDSATKGYSSDKRIGLFAGFVPANDPKFVVVVAIDEPKGIAYGGVVAAPAFKAIAAAALKNSGVFPKTDPSFRYQFAGKDDTKNAELAEEGFEEEGGTPAVVPAKDTVPNFIGMPMRRAIEVGIGSGVDLQVFGSGKAISQDPSPGSRIKSGGVCRVIFSKGGGT